MNSPERLSAYQKRLFLFLSVATFFEGYDQLAITQILPNFRRDFGLDEGEAGLLIAFINIGTVLAYLLVRQADRWGRRRVLTITIAGYTIFSLLTGLAPNVYVFAICQLIARVFLLGEWAISMVYAAEEFPARHRGLMLGLIQAASSFGAVTCAGVVPLLLETPWGWRTVYFVGTIPLVLLAFARRNLRESQRYSTLSDEERAPRPLTRILESPRDRKRVLQLAAIWTLTYVCTHTSVTFWKEYAVAPAPASGPHLSDAEVGAIITIAAVAAMPFVFAVGKLLDVVGRRRSAVFVFTITAASTYAAFTLETGGVWMTLAMVGAIFGASAVLPVLNAFTTELFPTHLRGDAFGWSNNLFGRVGYVLAPIAVGAAASEVGWGLAVASTAAGPMLALVLILAWMPETTGRELEDTAKL
jgi:putative MFS transporter